MRWPTLIRRVIVVRRAILKPHILKPTGDHNAATSDRVRMYGLLVPGDLVGELGAAVP